MRCRLGPAEPATVRRQAIRARSRRLPSSLSKKNALSDSPVHRNSSAPCSPVLLRVRHYVLHSMPQRNHTARRSRAFPYKARVGLASSLLGRLDVRRRVTAEIGHCRHNSFAIPELAGTDVRMTWTVALTPTTELSDDRRTQPPKMSPTLWQETMKSTGSIGFFSTRDRVLTIQ